MILQALKDYYDRKAADPDGRIAPEGFEDKRIPFIIVLDEEGRFVNLEFTGDSDTNKKGKPFVVPMWKQKSGKDSWKTTNLLWDHYGYVLGIPKSEDEKDIEQAKKQNLTFVKMVRSANDFLPGHTALSAILKFYESGQASHVLSHEAMEHAKSFLGCNMSFRLNDCSGIALDDADIVQLAESWSGTEFENKSGSDSVQGVCLVTGDFSNITRLHRPISGINKKPSPMLAVNNLESPAFASFNKKQGDNFPVGLESSFKYATALNHLLRMGSSQKIRIGEATVVFWSDKKSHFEDEFSLFMDEPTKDNPDMLTHAVSALLKSVDTGVMPVEDKETKFFILGLSPNAARISIRFWHAGTVAEFSGRLAQHFRDLEICHAPHERDHLSMWWLLSRIAAQEKTENIPPNLAGDWMRAILAGLPYPDSLFQAALRRIQAERKVSYARASIIKACLNRKQRISQSAEKEMTVSLDKENCNIGYRMGRLFAVLEKIQEDAQPNINATIRDRYYSAASGTPASVMPILMRMKNHHLAKLHKGQQVNHERQLGEILGEIKDFPSQLSLQDQGRFAIGYYHQRQDFFTKHESTTTEQGE